MATLTQWDSRPEGHNTKVSAKYNELCRRQAMKPLTPLAKQIFAREIYFALGKDYFSYLAHKSLDERQGGEVPVKIRSFESELESEF